MDILVAVASKVAELTMVPIGRQFGYMLFYHMNVRELKNKVEGLKAAREAVQHRVDAARRNCEEIEDIVQHWMRRVDEITEQAERFYEKESRANTGCSQRSFPNLWLRHHISRKAKKMAAEVDQLMAKGKFDRVSFHTLPQCIGPSSEVKETFKSRILIVNEIMGALADPVVHKIGLHGLGGVGKTTLTKQVAKKAEEEKLFEMVVWVEVKHKPLKEIQSQIAYKLQLPFDMQSESEIVTAGRLHSRLKQEKSVLVLLDDLWERLDLDQVGIPFTGEDNNCCKIILTSRSEDLLLSKMNCKKNVKVTPLSNEEAWTLFKEIAEINDDFDDPNFLSIAVEVSQKCGQLPLAIVAVAGALRNKKNLVKWKDALRRLKSYTSRDVSGIKEVDSSLKLSYDYLESKELKSTFLLSAMFSQDPSVEDLFMYSVGLGFLQDVHYMGETRDRLNTLIDQLKASSLLLDSYSKYHFTMHDVVRDMALSIAYEEQHVLVKRHEKALKWPDEDQLKSCTAICLDNSDNDELPEELNGPSVEFFLLYNGRQNLRISDSFFKGIQELKVLTLKNMAFSSLPSSICLLKQLRTLSLQSCCRLVDITGVECLKKLRVLNLSFSKMKRLPCEVGQLSCLQMLNLSHCNGLKVIPPNILSNLKRLEELYMRDSFNHWEAEGLDEGKERVSLAELKHLQKLSTLEIDIPDVTVLPKDLFIENSLERYNISIGTLERHDCNYESSRKLTLKLHSNVDLGYGAFKLLESVEDLCLENLKGVTSLCQLQTTAQTFSNLQAISVRRCEQLKSLFSISMSGILSRIEEIYVSGCVSMKDIVEVIGKENAEKGSTMCVSEFLQLHSLKLYHLPVLTDLCFNNKVFPKLETLILGGTPAKMMWNGNFQAYQFPNVKFLYLSGIHDRGATFSNGLFHGFPNLELLQVGWSSIEVIFPFSGPLHDTRNVAPFTKLNLQSLNGLKHIWNEKCQLDLILQNLKTFQIFHCHGLINLGPSFVSLANLTELVVYRCDKLINLLTSSTAKTLVQLTKLSVRYCEKAEEIITNTEEDVETEIVFAELKILELIDLANCKSFCCYNYTFKFPLLNEVIISGCPRFKIFCPGLLSTPSLKGVKMQNDEIKWQNNLNKTIQQLFDEKVLFRGVNLKIDEHPELIDIWNGKHAVPDDNSFHNLTDLVVDKCGFLSNHVIPSHVLISLINLTSLTVKNCDSVEVVFDLEGIDIDKDAHTLQAIPLWYLELDHLPKLKYVWNKEPHTIDCFQRLTSVKACHCESLKSVFPASIAKGLSSLQILVIESCGVEVIVAEDQTPTPASHFVFPKICVLYLIKLPNLKNFYPQEHTIDWGDLQYLDVRQCKKVKVFDWKIPKKAEKDAEDGVQNQYPLFLFEMVVPKLQELVLNQNDVKMIKNGKFQDDLFDNVQHLNLDSFNEDESLLLPIALLESFPSLSRLTLSHSSFKDIISFERSCSDPSRKVPQFTCLILTHLEQLQNIWNEDSQTHQILQHLMKLHVSHCSRLLNLAPSSSSFNKLIHLKVSSCHGLSYLFTTTTCKSLMCLRKFDIQDCQMMEEIVTHEGEDLEDKIILENLRYMALIDLPSLKSFCGQTCAFEFPSLGDVTIRECPKMKMFCGGVLITPLLEAMKVEENEEHWEGDLNKTLEQLLSENECQKILEG